MPPFSASADCPSRAALRRRRLPPTALSGALVALLISACASPTSPSVDTDLAPDAVVNAAWEVEADIVGGVAATEDGIVAYERRNGEFVVSAWSLDGDRLWSEPADPGWMADNDELTVRVEERDGVWNVIHLSSVDAGMALRGVIVREILTGQLVASAPGVIAVEAPHRCDDESGAICVVGWASERRYDYARQLRFEPGAHGWELDEENAHPQGTERLTTHVFLRGEGPNESIGHYEAGDVVWESRLADLLGSHRGHSSWGIRTDEQSAVTLLWFAQAFSDDDSLPLSDQAVLGVDSSTGERLWIEHSAGLCGALEHPVHLDPVVVCRYETGRETWRDDVRRAEGMSMSMAGLDLATGQELWSVSVDGHASHVMWTAERHSAPEGFATVRIDGSLARLDLRTGETKRLTGDIVFACAQEAGEVTMVGSGEELDFDAGLVRFPCDAVGDRVDEWTNSAVEAAGWRVDESNVVVRTIAGFSGFEIEADTEKAVDDPRDT